MESFFRSLDTPTGKLFRQLRDRFPVARAGTGRDADKPLFLHLNRGAAKSPFLKLDGEHKVGLHLTNLQGHVHEFGRSRDAVEKLRADVRDMVPSRAMHETSRGALFVDFSAMGDAQRASTTRKLVARITEFLSTLNHS